MGDIEDQASCLADRLSQSVSLLAGNCRSIKGTSIGKDQEEVDLEGQRKTLIDETLELSKEIFNSALKAESEHLPVLEALVTTSTDQSNQPTANQSANLLPRTPLEELYLPTETDPLAIWHQLSLRQNCLINWVKDTLDLDIQADQQQDQQDQDTTKKDTLALQLEHDPDSLSEESDELSSLDEEDDSSYATEQLFSSGEGEDSDDQSHPEPNESYVTTLNDADQDDSSQISTEDEDEDEDHQDEKKDKGLNRTLSLDKLESRSSSSSSASSKNKPKPRRSKVDSDFFSLAEFEQEAEDGEAEMRRKLRRSTGLSGQPEDDEDSEEEEEVDLFSRFDTGLIDDEDAMDDDEEEGGQVDLDSVADLRYNDFFAPIAKKPPGKRQPKPADTPSEPGTKKKIKLQPKLGKVKFSEEVKVKEIPAKNRGVRVAEMLSGEDDGDEDEDDDDDDVDFQSDDESGSEDEEDQEEGSDDHHSSGDSDSDSNDLDSQDEDGGEKTMNRLSGDLFDDGFSEDGSGSNDSDRGQAEEDLSRHAKKMKSLSKQIAQLEAENVAKKEWMMKGEAASKDRPQNSLLEEVLEFEHIQKIAPAVTEEKTQNLESLIKQRILEGNYDDVIRKRPIDPKVFLPSRLLELQDTQATKSLTEIYEDEYTKKKSHSETGQRAMDVKDEKLSKEHEELKGMFESLSGKLDALSNAHFTPHQPTATIKTINNLPAISLESSLPTATGAGTLLAPEELFNVRSTKELVTDVDSLTHAQKQNLRTHLKKHKSKSSTGSGSGLTQNQKKDHHPESSSASNDQKHDRSSVKEQKLASLNLLQKPSNTLAQNITILGNNSNLKRSSDLDLHPSKNKNKNRKLESGASLKL
ncbi:hypothetical protein PGT21_036623 [Puccinia graminis f. sp. tritici]|uniref:Uncharacterized protein n=2 Tax=Puccinia graminis f. sp. tritici TaxID=56615 RepID=E3KWB2_PUCGT|nr:uncharacterized protein PGTG_14792 [Puccinia graminis f. sp. tritici CRL 75-36-700-3]EFP88587.2 hypothetical protein PGTG_14792 [Puccinia graminis f. sp. tritici CRL 75-36-700-3]KAA1111106.1 hypothetical protein PGT21_036623 [Puccinia graminis f. sp. tritici]